MLLYTIFLKQHTSEIAFELVHSTAVGNVAAAEPGTAAVVGIAVAVAERIVLGVVVVVVEEGNN